MNKSHEVPTFEFLQHWCIGSKASMKLVDALAWSHIGWKLGRARDSPHYACVDLVHPCRYQGDRAAGKGARNILDVNDRTPGSASTHSAGELVSNKFLLALRWTAPSCGRKATGVAILSHD